MRRSDRGPVWPLAWEAAKEDGPPFFCTGLVHKGIIYVVSIDADGVLFVLYRCTSPRAAVHWALARCLRVYPYGSDALDALALGKVRPWKDNFQVQASPLGLVRFRTQEVPPGLFEHGEPMFCIPVEDEAGAFVESMADIEAMEAGEWPPIFMERSPDSLATESPVRGGAPAH